MERLIGIVMLLLCAVPSFSTHIMGGYFEYTCRGVDMNAQRALIDFRCIFYRDAASGGAGFDNRMSIGIYRVQEDGSLSLFDSRSIGNGQIYPIEEYELVPNFPELNISLQKGVFPLMVSIPMDGHNYVVAYQRCCRNPAINNIMNPDESGFTLRIELTAEGIANCTDNNLIHDLPYPIAFAGEQMVRDTFMNVAQVGNYEMRFATPVAGGGATNIPAGDPFCCTCVIPEAANCVPTMEPLIFQSSYSEDLPFGGGTNPVEIESGAMAGVIDKVGIYAYGLVVDFFQNGELLSRQWIESMMYVSGFSTSADDLTEVQSRVNIYPNPSYDFIHVESENEGFLNIYTSDQRRIQTVAIRKGLTRIELDDGLRGVLMLELRIGDKVWVVRHVKM